MRETVSKHIWPSDQKDLVVEVFYQQGDKPLICGINGWICGDDFQQIDKQLIEEAEDGQLNTDGSYLFRATYNKGHRDEFGRVEIPMHFELQLLDFRPADSDPVIPQEVSK